MPSRVKLALGIEREIIEDKIPEKDRKKKRGRPPGSKNVKSSKKGSSKKSMNQTEAVDGEDLQEEKRTGEPERATSPPAIGRNTPHRTEKSTTTTTRLGRVSVRSHGNSRTLSPEFLNSSSMRCTRSTDNEQGHLGMPRNDGVSLNLPIQGQLIQTINSSGVQQVLSHPAQGRSGRPLSAQDQQALSRASSGQHAQHQGLLTQGHQLLPAATTRGHPQAPLNLGQRSFPPAIQGQLSQSLPSRGQQNQPCNIKIKIKVEIEMSTEQFITVGQALFRHRHQNN